MKKLLFFLQTVFVCNFAKSQTLLPFNYLKPVVTSPIFLKNARKGKPIDARYGILFPSIKNSDEFKNVGPSFLSTNNITYNDSLSNISMYSELAADYFGPVRISIGTTLSFPKTDSSTQIQQKLNREKFIQRFATGGGSLVFNFTLPVYTFQEKVFNANVTFSPKFSLEPPSFGVSTNSFANNTSIGIDLQTGFTGVKNLISFFGYTRFAYTLGNSSFYDALQLKDDNRKGFWLNTYTIGVNVKDVFSISYQKFFGSNNIADKLSGYLTFTISPNFK
jgi:hypothetical protein